MPVPVNRSKIMPARGTKAVLEESLGELLEGEMAYATDERRYYQKQGGVLVAVGGSSDGGTGTMGVTTQEVETTEAAARRAGREVIPPDLPPGYTDLKNQREVNWWQHRETENVANRTTKLEQHQVQQDQRIYDLENRAPDIDGIDVDLDGYATEDWVLEQVAYNVDGLATQEHVDLQDAALDERLKVVEFDYTTTHELNAVNSRVTRNTKEIVNLQEGFDAVVIAGQEGADKLQIELQSYATKAELQQDHEAWMRADEKILEASQQADNTLGELIAANTKAIEAIVIPEVPEVPPAFDDSELKTRLDDLEAVVPEAFVGEASIPANPYPGQQWMNPDTLTVMVFWQGIWVPCAPPVHSDGGVSIPNLPPLP